MGYISFWRNTLHLKNPRYHATTSRATLEQLNQYAKTMHPYSYRLEGQYSDFTYLCCFWLFCLSRNFHSILSWEFFCYENIFLMFCRKRFFLSSSEIFFCHENFTLPWEFLFCCENFPSVVRNFLLQWGFFFYFDNFWLFLNHAQTL